jgi:hypothetical protein
MKGWKLRKFAGDVVYDLRSRGLLPIAIALAGAVLLVPAYFALTSSGGDSGADSAQPIASPEPTPENLSAVLAYDPGIRDYAKRLDHLQSKDPFKQQFTAPAGGASSLEQTVDAPIAQDSGSSGEVATTTPTTVGGSGTETGGGSKTPKAAPRYYTFETDVMVGDLSAPLQARRRIDPFVYLPNPEVPVLIFLGTQSSGKKAMFLVAKDVTAVTGGGQCLPAPDSCQMLALGPGQTEDLLYGTDGRTYRITVTRIELRVTSKPPKG